MAVQDIPRSIAEDPALLFLYRRVEETLGIRGAPEQLGRLKRYLEGRYGVHRDAYQGILGDREGLFGIAPFVTVNETYFFREGIHFRLLLRHLLPFLARLKRPIRICSAATSSGCEAYSIAMAADFYARGRDLHLGKGASLSWELDAFDLNPEMIDAAMKGYYSANALREDGAEWKPVMDLYLRAKGEGFEVDGTLRDRVRFFTHNIMEGLPGFYDIIFFRNALIYFSPENRGKILRTLHGALNQGGCLVVGVSETSSVNEEQLEMVHRMGAFYFVRKDGGLPAVPETAVPKQAPAVPETVVVKRSPAPETAAPKREAAPETTAPKRPGPRVREPLALEEIAGILEREDDNAARVLGGERAGLSSARLAAAAQSLLNTGDLFSAGLVISSLEERGSSPVASFLRGEFYYHGAANSPEANSAAEAKYQETAAAESSFWPALYRLCSLAEGGNRTRYEYRLKKALESMEKGAGRGYEIFIGGFSLDYYRRILEKKLAE
ncbi:MAG: hypothetical protein LBQ55_04975 [Treponema sp.]|jgi:chemotaxis protein methyltransferase CheR|nr:hypothetical protein [Treponema sp.]